MADMEDMIAAQEEWIEMMVENTRAGKSGIDAQIKLYLETNKTAKAVSGLGDALGTVTKGAVDSAKAMGNSTGNFTDLTSAVTATIGAVSGLLSAIPVVGTALGKLGDATAQAAEFAIGQVQKNYQSFQELAKAGQIGADGVTGMANQFHKAGLPLETYTKLLSKNSEDLAYFSANALTGGKTLSKMISGMDTDTKQYMRNLGYSIEEIGEAAIEYQALQRRRGYTDQMTQAQLTKGTANYVEELDAVAKLTGMQVKDLKAQRDEVRADSRFRARLIKIRADGNEKGAASMEMFAGMLNKLNPELRKGFSDITSGAINTDAALKMTRSGMLDTMKNIQSGLEGGKMTHAEALNMIIKTSKEISGAGGMMQGLAGVSDEAAAKFLDLAKTADIGNMQQKDMNKILKDQTEIRKKPDPTTDKLTSTMANLESTIATINKAFIATPLATDTIKVFSEALRGSVDVIAEAFGVTPGAQGVGLTTSVGINASSKNIRDASLNQFDSQQKATIAGSELKEKRELAENLKALGKDTSKVTAEIKKLEETYAYHNTRAQKRKKILNEIDKLEDAKSQSGRAKLVKAKEELANYDKLQKLLQERKYDAGYSIRNAQENVEESESELSGTSWMSSHTGLGKLFGAADQQELKEDRAALAVAIAESKKRNAEIATLTQRVYGTTGKAAPGKERTLLEASAEAKKAELVEASVIANEDGRVSKSESSDINMLAKQLGQIQQELAKLNSKTEDANKTRKRVASQ